MHGGLFVPLGEQQEALCKSCHNPTGTAAALSDGALHLVDGGTRIVDCGSCHDVHNPDQVTDSHTGQTGYNLSLVRANTDFYVPEAVVPAIFLERPGSFAYETGPFTGRGPRITWREALKTATA
jgi:hypothetical protein